MFTGSRMSGNWRKIIGVREVVCVQWIVLGFTYGFGFFLWFFCYWSITHFRALQK